MSECIAPNYSSQAVCFGFEKSSVATRCMHLNEDMNNHCWSLVAQNIGLRDEIVDGIDDIIPPVGKDTSCLNCTRYPCTYIKTKIRSAEPDQLTMDDLRAEANNCQGFGIEVYNE
jgi:hypothetical protein